MELQNDEQEYHIIKDIIIHENYTPNSKYFEYNFAIIKLVKPVRLTPKAYIVNLPSLNMSKLFDETARVLGWGLNENDESSTTLKEMNMIIITNRGCKSNLRLSLKNVKNPAITRNHICALSEDEISATCFGDSGGEKI